MQHFGRWEEVSSTKFKGALLGGSRQGPWKRSRNSFICHVAGGIAILGFENVHVSRCALIGSNYEIVEFIHATNHKIGRSCGGIAVSHGEAAATEVTVFAEDL